MHFLILKMAVPPISQTVNSDISKNKHVIHTRRQIMATLCVIFQEKSNSFTSTTFRGKIKHIFSSWRRESPRAARNAAGTVYGDKSRSKLNLKNAGPAKTGGRHQSQAPFLVHHPVKKRRLPACLPPTPSTRPDVIRSRPERQDKGISPRAN